MINNWTISDACRCLGIDDNRRSTVFSLMLGAYYGDDAAQRASSTVDSSGMPVKKVFSMDEAYELLRRGYKDHDRRWGSEISQKMSIFMNDIKNSIIGQTVSTQLILEKFSEIVQITKEPNAMDVMASLTPQAFLLSCCSESRTAETVIKSITRLGSDYDDCAYFYISVLKALINGASAKDLNASIKAGVELENHPQIKNLKFKNHMKKLVDALFSPDNEIKTVAFEDDGVLNIATLIVMILYFAEGIQRIKAGTQHDTREVSVMIGAKKHDVKINVGWGSCQQTYTQLQQNLFFLILNHDKDQCAYNTIVGAIIGALAEDVSQLEVRSEDFFICDSVKNDNKQHSENQLSAIILGGTRFWSFLRASYENGARRQISCTDVVHSLDFLFEKSMRIYELLPDENLSRIFTKIIVANVIPSVQKVMNYLKDRNDKKALIAGKWNQLKNGALLGQYSLNENADEVEEDDESAGSSEGSAQLQARGRLAQFCLGLCKHEIYRKKIPQIFCVALNTHNKDSQESKLFALNLVNAFENNKLEDLEENKTCEEFLSVKMDAAPKNINCNLDFLAPRSTLLYIMHAKDEDGVDLWSPDAPISVNALVPVIKSEKYTIKLTIDLSYKDVFDLNTFHKKTGLCLSANLPCLTTAFCDLRMMEAVQKKEHKMRFLNEYANIVKLANFLDINPETRKEDNDVNNISQIFQATDVNTFSIFLGAFYDVFLKQHENIRRQLQGKRNKMADQSKEAWTDQKKENDNFFILGNLCMYRLFDCRHGSQVIKQLTKDQLETLYDALKEYRRAWSENGILTPPCKDLEVFHDEIKTVTFADEQARLAKFEIMIKNLAGPLGWDEAKLPKPKKGEYSDLLLKISREEDGLQEDPHKVWHKITEGFWILSEKGQILDENNMSLQEALQRCIIRPHQAEKIIDVWREAFKKKQTQQENGLLQIGVQVIVIGLFCGAIALIYYFVKFLVL